MTILHLLSQQEVTGAETYVESLIAELSRRGHRFLVVSDTMTRPIHADYHLVRLHRRGWPDRFQSIWKVSKIVRDEKVDLLHAHSRATSWVGTFVSQAARVPLITTVHGIQHRHLSRKLFPGFGRIAVVVCPNIRKQLVKEMGMDPNRVVVIPNGIDLARFRPDSSGEVPGPVLLFLGRISGPKRQALKRFIGEVLEGILSHPIEARLHVVGRMDEREGLEKAVRPLLKYFGKGCVSFLGYQEDVPSILKSARVVLGSGRVVLEAMASGKPVVALGETDYLGVLTEDNFTSACDSNFGDCSPKERLKFDNAGQELGELLGNEKRCRELGVWGRKAVRAFDICKVADAVERIYQKCLNFRS